jgi:hypothetical protein
MQEHEGKYFLFQSEFGWLNAMEKIGNGYSLFRQVESEMKDLSPITDDTAIGLEDIVAILTKGRITEVHTGDLPEKGYCGIMPEHIEYEVNSHPEGECEHYGKLDDEDISLLKKAKIKVATLGLK